MTALVSKVIMNNGAPTTAERGVVRLAEIPADVSGRLWRVLAGMSGPDFNSLIDSMALLQFNAEHSLPPRPTGGDRREGDAERRKTLKPM